MSTASRAAPLRAVDGKRGTRSRKPLAGSVKAAAESGNHRELLVAVRTRIAADLDNPDTPSRDIAALSRRMLEIAKEIGAIDAAEKRDPVGDAAETPDAEWASS